MKKVLITLGVASLAALSSNGQGYVLFTSSTQNISTNNLSGAIASQAAAAGKTQGAGNFYYALFWSSTVTSGSSLSGITSLSSYAFNTAGWTLDTDASASAQSTGTAGRFAATAPNGDGSSTIPGATGGNTYYFTVVGWSANLGSTLAQAEAALQVAGTTGYIGQSAVSGLIQVGNGSSIGPGSLFGSGAPTVQAFTLGSFTIVPEPGTLALAALGGASLLLFRRKK